MATPDGYIREIESINKSLKRLSIQTKELREKKLKVSDRLYNWLLTHKKEEYRGYKLEKLAPKIKVKRKAKKEKKQDALTLFEEIGIPNPEQFWDDFQKTQSHHIQNEED